MTEEEKGNIINTYEYDIYGNRTGFTLANAGAQVLQNSYTYDNLNRLTGVTNGTETTAYSYDANGNVLYEQTGTKRHIYYSYNAAGLLTEKENVLGSSVAMETGYSYNLDGNIRQETEFYGTGTTTAYTYDGMGRLTGETAGGVTTSYRYDAYSNRAAKTVGEGSSTVTTSYTYDKNNRLLREHETVEGVETSRIYTYDPNGNQLAKTVHSSTNAVGDETQLHLGAPVAANAEVVLNRYDGLNRLISTERSKDGETTKASYTYNAAGIRTSKTVNGVTTQHLLDGVNVVADVTNGQTTSFVRGLGLISMNANGAKSYYVTDGHGDVRALVNGNGTVTKRYDYDAFGVEKGEDAADTNPFRYCGEYYDAETGSVYLRARYYTPVTGRFGAEDTYWNPENMIYGESKTERVGSSNTMKEYQEKIAAGQKRQQVIQSHIADIFLQQGKTSHKKIGEAMRWRLGQLTEDERKYIISESENSEGILFTSILQSNNTYVYCLNTPTQFIDPSGMKVWGVGISGEIGLGVYGSGQVVHVWDDKGNHAIVVMIDVGGGIGVGVGITGFEFSTMDNIWELQNQSVSVSIGAGAVGASYLICGNHHSTSLGLNKGKMKLGYSGTTTVATWFVTSWKG